MAKTREERNKERHRRRPKSIKPLVHTDAARQLRAWQKTVRRVRREIGGLLHRHELFLSMREIVNNDADTRTPGTFAAWMMANYVDAVCVGIRRIGDLTDGKHKVISLGRLLYTLLEHPGILTREWHRGLYPRSIRDAGDDTFDHHVGVGKEVLGERAIRQDFARVEKATARVQKFVNKRLAHAAALRELRTYPTYGEIGRALRVLDEVTAKYSMLLTADGFSTFRPEIQTNWRRVFHRPWLTEYDEGGPDAP